MNPSPSKPSREEILDAFAVELSPGRATLERYLRDYPSYATELVDLSRELSRSIHEDDEPLTVEAQAAIDVAWKRHVAAAPKVVADPFAILSVQDLRDVAKQLDVPRQVITAFREHRVVIDTVPRKFLGRLAAAINSTVDLVREALLVQTGPTLARSYKADEKPSAETAATFERLLADAGVSEEKRTALLADDN
jgi:hypothetical protein